MEIHDRRLHPAESVVDVAVAENALLGGTAESLEVFRDDDVAYLTWLERHSLGWVVNSRRHPGRDPLRLHRASCWTISGTPAPGTTWPTRADVKACSCDVAALRQWARAEGEGDLSACGHCASYAVRATRHSEHTRSRTSSASPDSRDLPVTY